MACTIRCTPPRHCMLLAGSAARKSKTTWSTVRSTLVRPRWLELLAFDHHGHQSGTQAGRSGSDWAGTSAATCACPVTAVSDWPGHAESVAVRVQAPGGPSRLALARGFVSSRPRLWGSPAGRGPPPPTVTRRRTVVRREGPVRTYIVDLRCSRYVSLHRAFGTCANDSLLYHLLGFTSKINHLLKLSYVKLF